MSYGVDQYDPLTPDEVERRLRSAIQRQAVLTNEYDSAILTLKAAEADYKIKFATARLEGRHGADGKSRDRVDDLATIASEEEYRSYLNAQATEASKKQALLSIRVHIDALRSLGANVRQAVG